MKLTLTYWCRPPDQEYIASVLPAMVEALEAEGGRLGRREAKKVDLCRVIAERFARNHPGWDMQDRNEVDDLAHALGGEMYRRACPPDHPANRLASCPISR